MTLQWRHNECHGVANHQPHDSLLNGYTGTDQRKHQNYAPLAFARGIHRWPVNSPHKGPVTRKMFPFDDVIMKFSHHSSTCFCTPVIVVEIGNTKLQDIGGVNVTNEITCPIDNTGIILKDPRRETITVLLQIRNFVDSVQDVSIHLNGQSQTVKVAGVYNNSPLCLMT